MEGHQQQTDRRMSSDDVIRRLEVVRDYMQPPLLSPMQAFGEECVHVHVRERVSVRTPLSFSHTHAHMLTSFRLRRQESARMQLLKPQSQRMASHTSHQTTHLPAGNRNSRLPLPYLE